jgi:hypothetical protein
VRQEVVDDFLSGLSDAMRMMAQLALQHYTDEELAARLDNTIGLCERPLGDYRLALGEDNFP